MRNHPLWSLVSIYFLYCITFVLVEIFYTKKLSFGLCFSESCLETLAATIPNFLELNKWIVTTSAIVIAARSLALSYKSFEVSRKNSIFNNHMSNKRFFSEHVNIELSRCSYLTSESIDINTFYSFIFPDSSNGSYIPSEEYASALLDLRSYLIRTSNRQKAKEHFNYRAHQATISNKLKPLGFEINSLPKKDFYLIESDLFKLIDSMTKLVTTYGKKYYLNEVDIHYR